MKSLHCALFLLCLCLSVGCGEPEPEPAPELDAVRSQVEAEDAAIEEAERANN